jgi:hypothetical protein
LILEFDGDDINCSSEKKNGWSLLKRSRFQKRIPTLVEGKKVKQCPGINCSKFQGFVLGTGLYKCTKIISIYVQVKRSAIPNEYNNKLKR